MIRKLRLENWRNYDGVAIDFEPGTTFVVASSGVGKTSLIEAARWAIFGSSTPDHSVVRAGAESARASVELVLPDLRVLFIERTLSKARRQQPPVVRLDGAPVPEADLVNQLFAAYGAEPGFFARLAMPAAGRERELPTSLGMEAHLGHYYGIDGLRAAIEQLTARRKEVDAQIRRIKVANATTARRLDEMQAEVERRRLLVEQATEAHTIAQRRADLLKERERAAAQATAWHSKYLAWTDTMERLAAGLVVEFGQVVPPDGLDIALDERVAEIDRQGESLRVEMAVNRTRESTLLSNEQGLDAAHDDCPVCRRPLDDATLALAHEYNARDLVAIRQAQAQLDIAERALHVRRQRLKSVQEERRRMPHLGPEPEVPAGGADEAAGLADSVATAESALATLVEARAAHMQSSNELKQAREANKAMAQLVALFREEAVLRAAIETTESTLTELLDETIRPLASEVNHRWQALFPDRGDIATYSSGKVTRTVNGHPLPYDAFSTGEGMGVVILLRLLVAQMATSIDFCWFDEPLEHLDPDVRRKVASMLTRVTSGEHRLRQVVVTTYEEPLARQLHDRDPDAVKLLDVRQAA